MGLSDFSLGIANSFSKVTDMANPLFHIKKRGVAGVIDDIGIDFGDFPVGFPIEIADLLADVNESRGVEELVSSRSCLNP